MVLHSKSTYIAAQKGLFCRAKEAVLEGKRAYIAKSKYMYRFAIVYLPHNSVSLYTIRKNVQEV
ncbi:hypothetical protein JCM15754A_18840 [Prevotella aurantiaca JCM 15754]